jgi:hypothetical protein
LNELAEGQRVRMRAENELFLGNHVSRCQLFANASVAASSVAS